MARKTRYYYDEETCSFQEEKLTPADVLKKVLVVGSISLLLTTVCLSAAYYGLDNPKERSMRQQINQLEASIKDLNKVHTDLIAEVDRLHQHDNEVYRSILGVTPVADGVFNGGQGGAADPSPQGSETVKEAERIIDQLASKTKLQEQSYRELLAYSEKNKVKLAHIPAIKPVPGMLISGFGVRMHPILRFLKMHTGVDLVAEMGTQVFATGDGVVKFVGAGDGYGLQVEIDHGYGYVSKYAHLSSASVRAGQKVKRGEVIAKTGSSGQSKGPHLHYEVIRNGDKVDPVNYFYQDYSPQEFVKLRKEAQIQNESMD